MHPGIIAASSPDKIAYTMAETGEHVTFGELEAATGMPLGASRRNDSTTKVRSRTAEFVPTKTSDSWYGILYLPRRSSIGLS